LLVFVSFDDPVKRLADVPGELAHAHVLARLFKVSVRTPTDVFGDFRILGVLAKNRLSIGNFCFSQS